MDDLEKEDTRSDLRRQAEDVLQQRQTVDVKTLSFEDAQRLIHELLIYQVELEIQNEDLRKLVRNVEASRNVYAHLYEFAPIGYFTLDEQGIILEVNVTGLTLIGTQKSALIQTPFLDLVANEERDIYHFHRKRLFETQTPQICEIKIKRRDGSQFHARLESSVLKDDEEQIHQYRTVVIDITGQKWAEEALRRSEQRYKRLLKTVTDYIYMVDVKDGRPVATAHGPGCLSVTGYTSEEYAANPQLWHSMVHQDDLASVVEQANQVLSGKAVLPLEHRIIHKDGSIRWVRNTPAPHYDEEGNLIAYDGLITDITQRKRAEDALHRAHDELEIRVQKRTAELIRTNKALQTEINERKRMQLELNRYTQELQINEARFRVIIEKSADGIIIVDNQGVVHFVNPAAEKLFDRKNEDLLGESFGFPIVAGETAEIDIIRKDGKIVVAEMRIVDTAWENTTAYLATFRDITERKQAETNRMMRFAVTSILAQAENLRDAIPYLLQSICECTRWEVGEMWLSDSDSTLLRWGGLWCYPTLSLDSGELETLSHTLTFTAESPFYGEVLSSAQPVKINLHNIKKVFARTPLFLQLGLTTAIAFPILNGREVIGIMSFFTRNTYQQNEDVIRMMADIGSQIGQFIARKRAEEQLRSAHRALRTLNECNQALIHATDESAFLHNICRIIVEVGGYRLAWAGFVTQDEVSSVHLVAQAGFEDTFIQSLDVAYLNADKGYGPISKVLRTKQPCVAKNILTHSTHMYWHDNIITSGYGSSVVLPLINNDQPFGVLNIYAEEPDAFGQEEVNLLMEMANDLAYGITVLRTRSERDQAERALRLYTERLKNMREIDQAILTAQTPEAIAQAALNHIRRLVPYQWASITALNLENGQPIMLAADIKGSDSDTSFAPPGTRLPMIHSGMIAGQQDEVRYSEDILKLPKHSPVSEQLLSLGIRSSISAPLIADGQLIGSINLGATSVRAFDEQHISIVQEVADQLAVAINHARLFEQVHAARERLQTLSRRLMEVQELERHHIARELHDEIGQSLTAVKISLQSIMRNTQASAVYPNLEESIAIVDYALQHVRNLSLDLRPSLLDDLGLEAALRWFIDRQAQWAGFTIEFVTDLVVPRLPTELETVCFRVTQEALTNIVRHAHASHVRVELQQHTHEIRLIVCDNGIGFDVHEAQQRAVRGSSLGLLGMQERVLFAGGKIDIVSSSQGTEIQARFPIPEEFDSECDTIAHIPSL